MVVNTCRFVENAKRHSLDTLVIDPARPARACDSPASRS
jgi:hypothetical protein